jgi:hypothetical protein
MTERNDMNDENDSQQEQDQQDQPDQAQEERDSYLTRSTMLPIEGIVYCLDHTLVHEDTVNPYGEGPESWCKKEQHRTVYYRGHKGDYDERQPSDGTGTVKRRIAAAGGDGLTTAERGLVVRLTRTLHTTLSQTRETLSQILGKDSVEGRESDPLLKLTSSILNKLGDEPESGGEPGGD